MTMDGWTDARTFHHIFSEQPSASTTLLYGTIVLLLVHQALIYLDYLVLSPQEVLWNVIVYFSPAQLLLDRARRKELETSSGRSQIHAAKNEALRGLLGTGSSTSAQSLPSMAEEGVNKATSVFTRSNTSDVPPGLGNWDNSCYQNSVLQGLAALEPLKAYLKRAQHLSDSTGGALLETVGRLNDADNNGKQLWTPAKLKSMSSWQQQDAQEYFSKLMDELDKEAAKAKVSSTVVPGLEGIVEKPDSEDEAQVQTIKPVERECAEIPTLRNPLEGLLAQRVACTRCGFSEGMSMIPFNCLTLPLGSESSYDVSQCLDDYTKLESISEVECTKCTLLHAEQKLTQMLPKSSSSLSSESTTDPELSQMLQLPVELRAQAYERLQAIQRALAEDDFADKTVNETCQISKKARVSTTKTRQAVIGRAPQSLVVHVNRSVFDEMTGAQRKNYANVRFPLALDLNPWMLSERADEVVEHSRRPESMLSDDAANEAASSRLLYRLKAVVTHYGRHENGHYICYRQHPVRASIESNADTAVMEEAEQKDCDSNLKWWRLSDEDVSPVSEQDVLAQGGVFMLFYERQDANQRPSPAHAPKVSMNESSTQNGVAVLDAQALQEEASHVPLPLDDDLDLSEALADPSIAKAPTNADVHLPVKPLDSGVTTEDDSEPEIEPLQDKPASPPRSPSLTFMRTARVSQSSRRRSGFGREGLRAVAAT